MVCPFLVVGIVVLMSEMPIMFDGMAALVLHLVVAQMAVEL